MNIIRQKCIGSLRLTALACAVLLAGCTGLQAPPVEISRTYTLDMQTPVKPAAVKHQQVLEVSTPRARSGFDTPQMAYLRQPHELNYYAVNRWVDTPARMLDSLLVMTLEQSMGFRAVVRSPSMVPANVRLDTELIRLQQDFTTQPSKVQFTLRAQLINIADKRVVAERLFDETEVATSDDAYGGVIAANIVLQRLLVQLTDFCIAASAGR